jgi:uncharacterized membrane protein YqaE (UPF0057 family)
MLMIDDFIMGDLLRGLITPLIDVSYFFKGKSHEIVINALLTLKGMLNSLTRAMYSIKDSTNMHF